MIKTLTRPQRFVYWFSRHWIAVFAVLYGLYVILPFFAPVFMHLGWSAPARVIYFLYSLVCHQLPDRSFYFFGTQFTIDLATVQAAWQDSANPLVLRQFIGNPDIGWKTAWSDRMVSMYGSIWVAGILWWGLRKRVRPLPALGLFALALPLVLDGTTHFVSDLGGVDRGFRYTNDWLAALTDGGLPAGFYGGNAWGSFNSWMRLVTGTLFGFGIVGYGFPVLDEVMQGLRKQMDLRLDARRKLQDLQVRFSDEHPGLE